MATKKILLVEGDNDKYVLEHICRERGIHINANDIVSHRGIDVLLNKIKPRLGESDIEALGIVIDADTKKLLSERWKSLKNILAAAGFKDIPNAPSRKGTTLPAPADSLMPRFGIWIMPNNRSPGIMEKFLQSMVPKNSRLFAHAQSSVASIPKGARLFVKLAEPKALIHTYLAWQKEPGKPYGSAISAGIKHQGEYLDPNVPQVDDLVSWLNRLFFPEAGGRA